MSGALLFALAGIVFFNRYLFLEPRLPIRLPALVQQALKYSAPCLLTAICGPMILMDHGIVRPIRDNPYLWGALFSVIIAFFIRNVLLAVVLSLIFFALLLSL
ncbi:MAG: AzlD domain-containing protein [Symbiopectobacterium sp.]|uniref:AzlD domain-containing protein n=1 Tax=Symbiopectobacterium sp. TaxID=2952789 RepID=UPI003F383A6A